jgi:1-acyl-sn-glycerol-3-phosphate acyltransferase
VLPENKLLALDKAEKLLKQDQVVAIFPEARLNPQRQALKSGTGAIQLSLLTGAPIIPVGFYVPAKFLHYFERKKRDRISKGHWQIHGHCYLHIGPQWHPNLESDEESKPADRHELTRRLMKIIETQALKARQDCARETGLPDDNGIDPGSDEGN